MRKIVPLTLLRLALLVAVFASAALVVEHLGAGDPAFCGVASGCAAVQRSKWSRIGPIPLPVIGLSAFAILAALALSLRDKMHTYYLSALATAGGAIGVALIAIQAVQIKTFCKWCVAVDTSAIVAALAAAWIHREASRDTGYEAWLGVLFRRRAQLVVWAVGIAIAGLLPIIWGEFPAEVIPPQEISALAVPGKVTIVSFTDFECPYCRRLHPALHDIVGSNEGRVVIDRKMVPLVGHDGARPAAYAYVCAPAAKREAMAEALYEAPLLSRGSVVEIAAKLGVERGAFEACLDAPTTKTSVDADYALWEKLDLKGLPYTFIGGRMIRGNNPTAAKKAARIALAGGRPSLPVAWMLAAFAGVALVLASVTPRLAPRGDAPPS